MIKGIDVSMWQGEFNFNRLKLTNISFVILKIGGADGGYYQDSTFQRNYKECKRLGIPVGCYYYGSAKNLTTAHKELEHILSLLKGLEFEYPFFYDVEGDMLRAGKRTLTDIIKIVLEGTTAAGIHSGFYMSEWYINNTLYDEELLQYDHWVAKHSTELPVINSGAKIAMWQNGIITIAGERVDSNYCYVDYPGIIKHNEKNNEKNEVIKLKILRYGSNCDDVTMYEVMMKKLGFYNGSIDTCFGPGCLAACNAFQEKYPECGTNGKPDGAFGPNSWNKLLSLFRG